MGSTTQSQRPARVIAVAGMPRSGSTWLFNAARLVLNTTGVAPYSCWVDDYDETTPTPVHLVKLHTPEQLLFPYDMILTTWRPIEECLASLVRMGWLKPEKEQIEKRRRLQTALYEAWEKKSDFEAYYSEITHDPEPLVIRLAEAINARITSDQAATIAGELAAMQPPAIGPYDPLTLLHPRHRA